MSDTPQSRLPRRLPSGISGLDLILRGGFLQNSIYLITGTPGSGKTILATQIAFNHIAAGGRVVYVTLLAENHAHLFSNLQSLSFFSREPIGKTIHYFSGSTALEDEGLPGLLALLRNIVRENHATLLVLDTLVTAEVVAETDLEFRRFIAELGAYQEVMGCTTLLITHPDEHNHPKNTLVDGLIELRNQLVGLRNVRDLEITKFRGSGFMEGRHLLEITDEGMIIHPRTEARLARNQVRDTSPRVRMPFDVPYLDEMLHSGLMSGSTTMLLGVPGSGKTITGLHFLAAGIPRGEPSLYFGLHETPERILERGDKAGLLLRDAVADQQLEIIWRPPLEDILDVLAERLLEAVERFKVRRLFIDSLTSFRYAADHPERIDRFAIALTNELRARNVTTVFAAELRSLFGATVELQVEGVSVIADNILYLRYVEHHSQLYRLITVLKARDSSHETAVREFRITEHGVDVAATVDSARAILRGVSMTVDKFRDGTEVGTDV